jgi:hypothetical protein
MWQLLTRNAVPPEPAPALWSTYGPKNRQGGVALLAAILNKCVGLRDLHKKP